MEQGRGKIVAGALAAIAPVALAPGAVVVCPPGIDVLTLAPGALEWALFPPQRMDIGVTVFGVEELVDI